MKYLKSYQNLNESVTSSEFYNLFNNVVYVTDVNIFGNDEYRVEYITQDGETSAYIGTEKDIDDDFLQTEETFKVKRKKVKNKISNKDNKTYDLVFYMGKRKMETIKHNISIQLANGLKKQYSSFPNYIQGELRVVPNK